MKGYSVSDGKSKAIMLSQQALHKVSPKMTLLYSYPEVGSGRYIINLMVFNTSLRQGAVPKGPTSPGTLPTESPTPIPSKKEEQSYEARLTGN